MDTVFKCSKCEAPLKGFYPEICSCGYSIPVVDGVYQMTDDVPISLGDNLKWLGYEKVGINYEPAFSLKHHDGDFGMMGACSRKLADVLGKDKIVLDIGAGLGQASIPLALAGVKTIAADISQSMMKAAVIRASENNVPTGSLICARMNAYRLRLLDHSIDAIIEIDMLHQVNKPHLVMDEIKRVLKPSGQYIKYRSSGLEYTEKEYTRNQIYVQTLNDIQHYYQAIITEAGYAGPPFSSWQAAENCINETFLSPEAVYSDEIIQIADWDIRTGLHKLITRASGSSQLIPDNIHERAWKRTNEYAINKFGINYMDINRNFRFKGYIDIYRFRV